MKIHVISDLHVDCTPYDFVHVPDAKIVIIAGDTKEKLTKNALVWMAAEVKRRGAEIVYVPGNHDFYRQNIPSEIARARAASEELGIHLLAEGESVTLHGVRIVGATLWTDYAVAGNRVLSMDAAASRHGGMEDHRLISLNAKFTPRRAAELHQRQRAAIRAVLETPFDGPTVVVTHHAPHPKSLRGGGVRELIDASYASDLTEMIEELRPTLWIHGHVHESKDYEIGDTRIVSNPRGRWVMEGPRGREVLVHENPAFDPEFTVTL